VSFLPYDVVAVSLLSVTLVDHVKMSECFCKLFAA